MMGIARQHDNKKIQNKHQTSRSWAGVPSSGGLDTHCIYGPTNSYKRTYIYNSYN